TSEQLGGASVHSTKSGVAHFTAPSDADALALLRRLFAFLPANNHDDAPRVASKDDPEREAPQLDTLVPENPNKPYDMHEVVRAIVDDADFLEVHAAYAKNLIVGFARLDGRTI